MRLPQRIKEEMREAVDDSSVLINPSELKKNVEKVKETIAEPEESYSENISALDNIISMINGLSGKENTEETLNALKSNAEILKENCREKLSSIQAWPKFNMSTSRELSTRTRFVRYDVD